MPNGTGKTTVLKMIRAALTGEARDWKDEEVQRYQRRARNSSEGKFVIDLLIDEETLTFEMTFKEKVRYRTSSLAKGGVVDDWSPPEDVRRFLDPKFIDLFVFDGELAFELLKPKEAKAEGAIDAVCQLYLFDECEERANNLWEDSTKGKSKTDQALNWWRKEEKKRRELFEACEKRYREAKAERSDIKSEISKLEHEIVDIKVREKEDEEKLEKLKEEVQKSENKVIKMSERVMQRIRVPYKVSLLFKESLKELRTMLDRVRLPPSTSKQFFVELSQEENCICGRPIDDSARDSILKRAQRYLGEEITGILNGLKEDIENMEDGDSGSLQENISDLKDAVHCLGIASDALIRFKTQSPQEKGEGFYQKKSALLSELEKMKKELDELIESMEADEGKFSLKSLEEEHKEAKKRVEEISGTVKLGNQIDKFIEICQSAKEYARKSIKTDLITKCNERLKDILPREPVRIAGIERSLELEGQRGASVGQTLAVGYTFLTSLLHRGQHNFPLVVDSPAGPIDISVRREIGSRIPKLCKQFLAFTISSERAGFVQALDEASSGKVRYLTLFRRTGGTRDLERDLPKEGVTETENGLLIESKEYFLEFDLDEE